MLSLLKEAKFSATVVFLRVTTPPVVSLEHRLQLPAKSDKEIPGFINARNTSTDVRIVGLHNLG
jgi:hypothetical protein